MTFTKVDTFPHSMLLNPIGPCISIYMPTHRLLEDEPKDITTYHHLVKEVEASLHKLPSSPMLKALIAELYQIKSDHDFWRHQEDGLALFANLEKILYYQVKQPFVPFAVVADSFHIKPLYAFYQHHKPFHVLALEAETFAIYRGNHLGLVPIELPFETPLTLVEVLGDQLTDDAQTNGVYGGSFVGSTFHGRGGKKDAIAIDREKYFRYVDRTVDTLVSKLEPLPLIVVTPKDHQFLFQSVCKNPHLISPMITGTFSKMSSTQLAKELSMIAQLRFDDQLKKVVMQYQVYLQKKLSSDDLETVAKALMESRVETLFIEVNTIIPGHLNLDKQRVSYWQLSEPHTDDVLDDMLQMALTKGTAVYVIDQKQMPTTQGVAGKFRY